MLITWNLTTQCLAVTGVGTVVLVSAVDIPILT